MVDNVFAMAQVREGRLRALAVSTGTRMKSTPEIPSMTESGIPLDVTGYFAAMVPTGTPQPIIDQTQQMGWRRRQHRRDPANSSARSRPIRGRRRTADAQAYYLKDIDNWKDYIKVAKIEQQGCRSQAN